MRKFLAILIFAGAFALGFGFLNQMARHGNAIQLISPVPKAQSSILQTKQVNFETPVKLSIPKLKIDADVESVGLDKDNAMDVPKADENVGWYNLGAKPGQMGNAVIAGHLDRKNGKPAVFYDLNELEKGDEIIVTDENNQTLKFIVTDVETYKNDEFPLKAVFGDRTTPRLNLITCKGIYDKTSKLYSDRLVVYSELES